MWLRGPSDDEHQISGPTDERYNLLTPLVTSFIRPGRTRRSGHVFAPLSRYSQVGVATATMISARLHASASQVLARSRRLCDVIKTQRVNAPFPAHAAGYAGRSVGTDGAPVRHESMSTMISVGLPQRICAPSTPIGMGCTLM
jgi:hypothetical protein